MWHRKSFEMSGTKFRWDRGWVYYWVEPILDEALAPEGWPEVDDTTKKEYSNNVNKNWSSFVIELKTPIVCKSDIKEIISTPHIRIYPPFPLNQKEANSGLLSDAKLPVGNSSLKKTISIPDYAIKAASTDMKIGDSEPCYGLRIDIHKDIAYDVAIEFFLQLVRQYSKQWWVSTAQNPFDIGVRINFQIENDNSPRLLLKHKGAGQIAAPWYGVAATQNLVGIEIAVDQKVWSEVGRCMRLGYGREDVLQYFMTAVASFMSYEDNQTILNLAFMFEVAENKVRILKDKNSLSKNKDILKNTIVATDHQVNIFRKLITDRDNIAHGRRAYHASKDPRIMVEYLEACTDFINRYLDICRELGWDKALKTAL